MIWSVVSLYIIFWFLILPIISRRDYKNLFNVFTWLISISYISVCSVKQRFSTWAIWLPRRYRINFGPHRRKLKNSVLWKLPKESQKFSYKMSSCQYTTNTRIVFLNNPDFFVEQLITSWVISFLVLAIVQMFCKMWMSSYILII